MLKRALIICLLILGLAAAAKAEKEPLFPAYDEMSGKWGYINQKAEFVIPPQFDFAGIFRGDYAAAAPAADRSDASGFADTWGCQGIIDRRGSWVVEPAYVVDDGYDGWTYGGLNMGHYFIWKSSGQRAEDEELKTGFFDVRSGFFSGLISDAEIDFRSSSRLVPVLLDHQDCYMDRTNGRIEIILPDDLRCDITSTRSEFSNGFAMVLKEDEEDDSIPVMIDEQGSRQSLDGLKFFGDDMYAAVTPGGIMRVQEKETGLYGYYDLPNHRFLIPPRYSWADDFSVSGCACVRLDDGTFGHIDHQGNVLASGFSSAYTFLGEYAFIKDPANSENRLIDTGGNTVLTLPRMTAEEQWDDELRDEYNYYVTANGLLEVDTPDGVGVINVRSSAWVLPPEPHQYIYQGEEIFSEEGWRFFSEGIQAVARGKETGSREVRGTDGTRLEPVYTYKIAYMNEQGEFITGFIYDDAGAFLHGLARVSRDGLSGYIDQSGKEVYMWKEH